MEKYHFCIVDGEMIDDPVGTHLAGIPEAKVEAASRLMGYVRDQPGEVWEQGSITVWATNHVGQSLFRLDLFLTNSSDSPALFSRAKSLGGHFT